MARNNSYNPGFPVDPISFRQIGQEINYVLNDAGLFVPVSDNDPMPTKGVGPAVDISGKNRASVRHGIFANTNFFSRNETIWNEVTSGGSETITHDFNHAACALTVGTASGEFALRQSFFRPPYDPGNPNRGQFTFIAPPWKVNQGLEIAFGDDDNGILLVRRASDGALGFLLRSNASGSIVDSNVVYQDDWNGDKLNGSGESGFTLDITKRTLLWSSFLWQGVGPVEFGFQLGREWITCHTFENANTGDRPYVPGYSHPD